MICITIAVFQDHKMISKMLRRRALVTSIEAVNMLAFSPFLATWTDNFWSVDEPFCAKVKTVNSYPRFHSMK